LGLGSGAAVAVGGPVVGAGFAGPGDFFGVRLRKGAIWVA
jgi:hypothetical protein